MNSLLLPDSLLLSARLRPPSGFDSLPTTAASRSTCLPYFALGSVDRSLAIPVADALSGGFTARASSTTLGDTVYTVGDFMTKKEELIVVKPTTTVDEALEFLVEYKIKGFPVIDDDWNLVGVVSDYDLLALDSISGNGGSEVDMFPEVDSSWKMFVEVQKLLSKTNGKVIGELMTPAPLVVRETTNLEDAARLLLETKYRRLPVVDSSNKLVGIITRGNVIGAALQIKKGRYKDEPK